MHNKLTSYVLMLAVVLNGLGAVISCSAGSTVKVNKDEEVDIVTISASPNEAHVATIYTVWGGGAAGYVYRLVNIRKRSEPFGPQKGIVFLITGAGEISLMWGDDEHLTIKYPKIANIYTQSKSWGSERKIQIHYVAQ